MSEMKWRRMKKDTKMYRTPSQTGRQTHKQTDRQTRGRERERKVHTVMFAINLRETKEKERNEEIKGWEREDERRENVRKFY